MELARRIDRLTLIVVLVYVVGYAFLYGLVYQCASTCAEIKFFGPFPASLVDFHADEHQPPMRLLPTMDPRKEHWEHEIRSAPGHGVAAPHDGKVGRRPREQIHGRRDACRREDLVVLCVTNKIT